MAWILLEGLDRSGKSSVAEHYKKKGYKVVHMEAPDKKYFNPEYGGESYLEEVVRMYSEYDNQDIVFDRTVYGELVWPNIFSRQALLNDEDLEYLSMMERNNEASKILLFDSNMDAHWQRCVDNKEPLNRQQFGRAGIFYERLAEDFGFVKKELSDFPEIMPDGRAEQSILSGQNEALSTEEGLHKSGGDINTPGSDNGTPQMGGKSDIQPIGQVCNTVGNVEDKLERANAIRALLSGTIVKKKGKIYGDLDEAIRGFLQQELDSIFSPKPSIEELTLEEITILKGLAQRVKEKM